MARCDYRCRICGHIFEWPSTDQVIDWCENPADPDCRGRSDRIWGSVHIGQVPGAGGSPAR